MRDSVSGNALLDFKPVGISLWRFLGRNIVDNVVLLLFIKEG